MRSRKAELLSKTHNRMYGDLAHLWPLVSPPEGYGAEAAHWRAALRDKLGTGRHTILELGVGGGNNLSHLTSEFDAVAVDVSGKMLAHSRRLNPSVEHHIGDMRNIRLGRKFNAVLIHDAISYMLTEQDLRATFATAAAHLNPGGVFITAPDVFRETFHWPFVTERAHQKGNEGLALLEFGYDPDPTDTMTQSLFVYLIRARGQLKVEYDEHTFGLFPIGTWVRLMSDAGFEVEKRPYPVHEDHREAYLLVGTLR
ncbi:MAG: class I SAM-dependent methyltransferase [bacterium]